MFKSIIKKICFASLVTMFVSSCATSQNPDPLESINRPIYSFNKQFDHFVFKPVAKGYHAIVPDPIERSVSHIFDNLGEISNILNSLLQFKFQRAIHSTGRLMINSSYGILGIFDVASEVGIPRYKEDFGQTLAYWGYSRSAYFVIPFLGPSTIRDTISLPVNYYMHVYPYIEPDSDSNRLITWRLIDHRAKLLDKEKVLEAAAVDEYVATRDAYLQHRAFLINDGLHEDEDHAGELEELDF